MDFISNTSIGLFQKSYSIYSKMALCNCRQQFWRSLPDASAVAVSAERCLLDPICIKTPDSPIGLPIRTCRKGNF